MAGNKCKSLKQDGSACGKNALPGAEYCGNHLRMPEELDDYIRDMEEAYSRLRDQTRAFEEASSNDVEPTRNGEVEVDQGETRLEEQTSDNDLSRRGSREQPDSSRDGAALGSERISGEQVAVGVGVGVLANLLYEVLGRGTSLFRGNKKEAGDAALPADKEASPVLTRDLYKQSIMAAYHYIDHRDSMRLHSNAEIMSAILDYEIAHPRDRTLSALIWKHDYPIMRLESREGSWRYALFMTLVHGYIKSYLRRPNGLVRTSLRKKAMFLLFMCKKHRIGNAWSVPRTTEEVISEKDRLLPKWFQGKGRRKPDDAEGVTLEYSDSYYDM